MLRELAAWLPGRQVMWFVYCGNDLADNLRPDMVTYRMPLAGQTGAAP